jgi:hypothetical protein
MGVEPNHMTAREPGPLINHSVLSGNSHARIFCVCFSAGDLQASKMLTTAWSNFIKTGDPQMGWEPVTR